MLENTVFLSCEYLAQYSQQLQTRCKSEPSSGPMSRRWTAFQLRCLITWGQLSSTHWNGWFKNGSLCSLHSDPMSCRRRFTSEPEWQWWERRRATERANQNTVCWWMAPCSQWMLPPHSRVDQSRSMIRPDVLLWLGAGTQRRRGQSFWSHGDEPAL